MLRMLRNRYYTGWISYNGVEYKGAHPPLIDDAIFDRVQALLTARNLNKDKDRKRPHHLKGFIYCALCSHRLGITVVTKQSSGNTYAYFYCLGRQLDRETCSQHRIPIGDLEDAVHDHWARLRIPSERILALRQAIIATFEDKQELGKGEIEEQHRRVRELEQRRKKAKAAYFANVLDLEEFKVEQATIRHGIHVAEEAIAKWSVDLDSITQSLDDALRLVEDPQGLYDALPEGLKVLLMQAVFTKLWILETRVVGSELTDTYSELLTLDARLVLDRQSEDTASNETITHFRRREVGWLIPSDTTFTTDHLALERPYGLLPIDNKNRCTRSAHGWNMQHLVRVTGHKSNSELVQWMREHPLSVRQSKSQQKTVVYRATKWRLRDRLTDRDVVRLVMAFKTGIATKDLSAHYDINVKSVRKLLRDMG